VDAEYFRDKIEPLLGEPGVEFVGEINEREKTEFLGQAMALLFPIDWPEPFGLSMIEAMACGTPVLAFRCGSVSEIIDPGVTGLVVNTMEETGAPSGDALRNDFQPHVWPRIMFRSIDPCSSIRRAPPRDLRCPGAPSTARDCSRSWKRE
jgi:hypothetical protein